VAVGVLDSEADEAVRLEVNVDREPVREQSGDEVAT
jgi:hypothetical protein